MSRWCILVDFDPSWGRSQLEQAVQWNPSRPCWCEDLQCKRRHRRQICHSVHSRRTKDQLGPFRRWLERVPVLRAFLWLQQCERRGNDQRCWLGSFEYCRWWPRSLGISRADRQLVGRDFWRSNSWWWPLRCSSQHLKIFFFIKLRSRF